MVPSACGDVAGYGAARMTIRVAQLSDTHFLEPDHDPEGGFGYDIAAAFDLVEADLSAHDLDAVVVTGDIADHGRPAQYRLALEAFERLRPPVWCTPGNHDRDAAFQAGLTRSHVSAPRLVHVENWCFAFVDSNVGVMLDDGSGHRVDPEHHDRLHGNGLLGSAEAAWLRQVCATTDAEHVFVWVHHPPASGNGAVGPTPEYQAEWRTLLAELPMVRGFGAGHTHVPTFADFEGTPVHIGPALKNNFDLDEYTFLPPGWRRYEFGLDGTVTSTAEFVDDERFPRAPLPRSVAALLRGELTHEQFDAIVARRAAAAG